MYLQKNTECNKEVEGLVETIVLLRKIIIPGARLGKFVETTIKNDTIGIYEGTIRKKRPKCNNCSLQAEVDVLLANLNVYKMGIHYANDREYQIKTKEERDIYQKKHTLKTKQCVFSLPILFCE